MAQLCKQIAVVVADEVGRLAEITDAIKAVGVNILALCAWVEDTTGHLMAVTDDNEKACAAVGECVDACEFNDVVCVKLPNTPGALGEVAHKLADAGIGIRVIYATAGDHDEAVVVLITDDNAKAAEII